MVINMGLSGDFPLLVLSTTDARFPATSLAARSIRHSTISTPFSSSVLFVMYSGNDPRSDASRVTYLFTSSVVSSLSADIFCAVSGEKTPSFAAVFSVARLKLPMYPPENIFSKL